ncbi:MAG TPA: branched-chain amino acid ABC transporter permease [Candidatus Angelobacter sp.]|nr:branched-chain amino acid ABC transporter permease [Candidatus Angelobacter sp.]
MKTGTPASGIRFSISSVLPWLLLVALIFLPSAGLGTNLIRLFFLTLVWIVTSVAWNLVGGFAGQVSFGFAVFYGVGAYTGALLMNQGVSPYAAMAGAAAMASIASLIVGAPTFRLRGPYFVIATIGVNEAVRVLMSNLAITGGASGLRLREHGPYRQVEHYYTALGAAAIAIAISAVIARSRFGLALRAIRQDEDAAADVGVNAYVCKLYVHAIAAALTGMAGAIFARYAAYINPQGVFAFNTSISILLMPVIGGIGTIWGPVLGGVVFGAIEEQLVANFPNIHLLLYGGLLMLIVLVEPDGLVGLFHRIVRRRGSDSRSKGIDKVLWGRSRLEGREL